MAVSYGVTLLSGGLDSTTVTAYALGVCDDLTALTFQYGQSHSKEVDCAARIAAAFGVEHRLLDISFFREAAWYSALTNPDSFPIPGGPADRTTGGSVPITYVPLRNTFFLTLAAAFLESRLLHAIEAEHVSPGDVAAHLFMAPNAVDYSGYPDCRPEFFDQMSAAIRYGSKVWTEYDVAMQVQTPIIDLSKADIVRMGVELNAPLELTWSCYDGGAVPCGACDSCVLRARGFREAGLQDPLLTHLEAAS